VSRSVRAAAVVPMTPPEARALWTDTGRWASFVEGFGHLAETRGEWPASGSQVVWNSTPGGRGRVTEKVVDDSESRFATRISEEAMQGEQSAEFSPAEDGTRVDLRIDYELTSGGPLQVLSDVLFIRRALRDALTRTLRRYVTEATEEVELKR
jgi:Polyketide cyclase / dehydrase and lipid transport